MEPWGTPVFTGYSCEDFPSITTRRRLLLRENKAKYLTWNCVRVKSVKISMPNLVKSLGYTKCSSLSSLNPIKSPSNSIRYNFQAISCWSRVPTAILEIRKKVTFLYVINKPIIYKFFKDFTNHRKMTNRTVVFSCRPFLDFLKYWDHGRDIPTIWKTRFFQKHIEEFS